MIENLTAPSFLIISSLAVGGLNLLAPFASKEVSKMRSLLLILISMFFLLNVITIDQLFLSGIRAKFTLFYLGSFAFKLHLEPLGIIFLNLLALLWPCALIYTEGYTKANSFTHTNRFIFFLNLSILSACLLALTANLFSMFICYEILTLSTIPLISHNVTEKTIDGLNRYLKILIISSLVLFLPAIIIIQSSAGHTDFINKGFIEYYFSPFEAKIILLLFIFGIAKSALYPLHSWLPAAMVASYPVSALLHAVAVVKTGLFCTFKVLVYIFGLEYLQSIFADFNWLLVFPFITILYSAFKALRQDNIKTILAYSTISQLALSLLSAFMFTPKAIGAAVLHMLAHSFSKICLFYAAGAINTASRATHLHLLPGVSRLMPFTSLILLISALSIIGVPPFGGFISKFYILLASNEQENFFVTITIIISSMLTASYMLNILVLTYQPAEEKQDFSEKQLPRSMLISLGLCVLGVVFFFLLQQFANLFLEYLT